MNFNAAQSTLDMAGSSMSLSIGTDGLDVLNALIVVNRSMHNCRVFGYYGGIQKLTALMKGIPHFIVLQLFVLLKYCCSVIYLFIFEQ